VHGGRENLEAISLLQRVNEVLGTECPGAFTVAEESTSFPGVSSPTWAGGLGFHFKWNMGWMNDTLRYMQEDPVHRRWHHERLTFGLLYAFSEHFVLPLSHDEVVHGKRSLLGRMPGDDWQRFANLRAYLAFMWAHPGKKLLFMGQEFAQPWEWNHDAELPWALLRQAPHAGMQRLVRELNRLLRDHAALHRSDSDAAGFTWLDADDRDHSVLAWVRRAGGGAQPGADMVDAVDPLDAIRAARDAPAETPLVVVCNFTPVPRHGWRVGVPADAAGWTGWREVLNTDATDFGGSGVGNGGVPLAVESVPWQGQPGSLVLTLPPLATLVLAPCR
jgi:1,4-alpha-glucan branching enzyme